MADSFDRFEQRKKTISSSSGLSRFERWSSPHTHPGLSVTRLIVQKLRVLALFVIRRIAQGSGRENALAGLASVKDSATSVDVLVLASGPSADTLNSREVAKRQKAGELIVVATNYFLHSPLAQTITPDYLVWSDRIFHPRHRSENSSWEALTSHPTTKVVSPWTWQRHIPHAFRPQFLFFDDDTLEGWSSNISPLKPRGYQGTTGAKAIALASHLGAQNIYLLGLDLSYFKNFSVDASNKLYRHPSHISGTDSGSQDITHNTVHGLADTLYSTANQFLQLHTHFSGLPVTNLDPTSLVDVFAKAEAHPLVKKARASKKP